MKKNIYPYLLFIRSLRMISSSNAVDTGTGNILNFKNKSNIAAHILDVKLGFDDYHNMDSD